MQECIHLFSNEQICLTHFLGMNVNTIGQQNTKQVSAALLASVRPAHVCLAFDAPINQHASCSNYWGEKDSKHATIRGGNP